MSSYQEGLDAYERGDYDTVMKDLRQRAEQGDANAQFELGFKYAHGQGVSRDDQEAAKLYRLSAEQGNAAAQYRLGLMYHEGLGIPQDYQEALRWFRLAADQGHAGSQDFIGNMYVLGQGVPRDYVLAHMWSNLAAAQGYELAIEARDLLEKRMTPAQLAEAQRLAREWTPKGE